jgi:hypothetical protein
MQADAYLHHPIVRFDEATPSHLIVTLKGDEGDKARPPLNLVITLDKSGSMNDERKLPTVIHALNHLTQYLSKDDHVALVTFDAAARVVAQDLSGSDDDVATLKGHLSTLRGGGATNIDQGLATAVSLANTMTRERPDSVTRIVLLTDGEITEGEKRPETVMARLNIASPGIGLTTIGVGTNCDHDLLGRLALRGHGSYGFVETPEQAAEVLGVEIGGLVNLDAAAVVVRVQGRAAYLEMKAPLGVEATKDADEWVIELGTLIAGQVRSVVFPVTTKALARANARPVTISDVAINARGSEGAITIELRPKLRASRVAGEREARGDEIVDRAVLAEAQKRAETLARRGDFAGASQSFSALGFNNPGYELLATGVASGYAEGRAYNTSAVMRSSASAMLSASSTLIGSSDTYNAMTSRSIGDYGIGVTREVGAETRLSVSETMSVAGGTTPANLGGQSIDPGGGVTAANGTGGGVWPGGTTATGVTTSADPGATSAGTGVSGASGASGATNAAGQATSGTSGLVIAGDVLGAEIITSATTPEEDDEGGVSAIVQV